MPALEIEPGKIPPEVEVKGLNVTNQGRLSLSGPGRVDEIGLDFNLSRSLTRDYLAQGQCTVPAHALFPQLARIVERYVAEKVRAHPPADTKDLFLAPYYGWVVEVLLENIHPDASQGETPEVPRYETTRGPGSTAEVDFWTSRDVREVQKCHLNYAVLDTAKWEQSAAFLIDRHPAVEAFVKNAGLGFAIPYLHNGQMHDYAPDFIARLKAEAPVHLILETKGFDPLADVKRGAAERWVNAVNADGAHGRWLYAVARKPTEIDGILAQASAPEE